MAHKACRQSAFKMKRFVPRNRWKFPRSSAATKLTEQTNRARWQRTRKIFQMEGSQNATLRLLGLFGQTFAIVIPSDENTMQTMGRNTERVNEVAKVSRDV